VVSRPNQLKTRHFQLEKWTNLINLLKNRKLKKRKRRLKKRRGSLNCMLNKFSRNIRLT